MVIMVYIIYLRQDFFNFCTIGSKPFIVNSISITIVASHFDTLNTKIGLLFHILDTEIGWCEKSEKHEQEQEDEDKANIDQY